MRTDNRLPDQMRPVEITTGYLMTAEGSALIAVGNTRVLCAASVEDSVPPFLRGSGKGWVTAEYSMLPRATAKRTPREVDQGPALGPHARNPAADRPLAARGGGHGAAGRAHRDARLRRAAGRWRHAHGFHHGRLRGAGAGAPAMRQVRDDQAHAAARLRGRHQRRHRRRRCRCSICATKRTRRRRWI